MRGLARLAGDGCVYVSMDGWMDLFTFGHSGAPVSLVYLGGLLCSFFSFFSMICLYRDL
jgi:hypothetical protein